MKQLINIGYLRKADLGGGQKEQKGFIVWIFYENVILEILK